MSRFKMSADCLCKLLSQFCQPEVFAIVCRNGETLTVENYRPQYSGDRCLSVQCWVLSIDGTHSDLMSVDHTNEEMEFITD